MAIAIIKTDSGRYNVVGTEDGAFILQGNLTKDQLKELVKKAQAHTRGKD